ncbi:hypothetical protein RF11_00400 [Thelohanellus kitauei]|uniref:Uncharacterized protein n=1 Tax=Thelohanellus kitauei TaxID=669202 RepID=A0A0C2JJJ5_THEKT|nr:hypothetical protein RF11_00400 [Thelohanellus kitauei]
MAHKDELGSDCFLMISKMRKPVKKEIAVYCALFKTEQRKLKIKRDKRTIFIYQNNHLNHYQEVVMNKESLITDSINHPPIRILFEKSIDLARRVEFRGHI